LIRQDASPGTPVYQIVSGLLQGIVELRRELECPWEAGVGD